jgi:predicted extracellular nuclease
MKPSFIVLLLVITQLLHAQRPAATIAFWNVENLYDTIDDPAVNDEEFLPAGKNHWTRERYNCKLQNLSKVILSMNSGSGPDILGLAEIENKNVLFDLTQCTGLKSKMYGIVHFDSPDKRGIDVALIYRKKKFRVLESKAINVSNPADTFFTRDILLVKGILGKTDTIWIFVNHWPSRRGGKDESDKKRMRAALILRNASDSIERLFPRAQILVMGDFNDEPTDKSIRMLAFSEDRIGGFVNLMDSLKAAGDGSYHYKKEKNMLDQVMVTKSFRYKKGYYVYRAEIYRQEWMTGINYKDDPPGPLHTYAGSRYIGGYSDHYPVIAYLLFEK